MQAADRVPARAGQLGQEQLQLAGIVQQHSAACRSPFLREDQKEGSLIAANNLAAIARVVIAKLGQSVMHPDFSFLPQTGCKTCHCKVVAMPGYWAGLGRDIAHSWFQQ